VFDHVGIRVGDREASRRFYNTVLGTIGREGHFSEHYDEWEEWATGAVDAEHPLTRHLHVGFYVPDQEAARRFWQAGVDAGYGSDGEPGPRPEYGDDYFGGFLLDPDGNSVEAMTHDAERTTGQIDHVWIRVESVEASAAFYETIAPYTGYVRSDFEIDLDIATFRSPTGTFSVLRDDRPRTEHVHLAFPASDHATVEAFHAAAVAAGYADNGGPGERPEYHAGYYGAFVIDPDGHNVEVVDHSR
jgi:catechol 2,3-dioxygenase-like lactoylglutathione lyase family enzyme